MIHLVKCDKTDADAVCEDMIILIPYKLGCITYMY